MSTAAPPARLKVRYLEEIRPELIERFGYSSVMQAPKIVKITLNMGVGMAKQEAKVLRAAREQLATIAGQQPSVRRARKSIAAFKLREGNPVGVSVTLRSERSYEFLDRLISIAIPRIRDFRGLSPRSFDGRGNYSLGVREQIIFPEVDYDAIDEVRGLDITITTTAASDREAFALLSALGMPFAAQGRPAEFEDLSPRGAGADSAPASAPAGNGAAKAQTGKRRSRAAAEKAPEQEPAAQEAPEEEADAQGAPESSDKAEQAAAAAQTPEAEQAPPAEDAPAETAADAEEQAPETAAEDAPEPAGEETPEIAAEKAPEEPAAQDGDTEKEDTD